MSASTKTGYSPDQPVWLALHLKNSNIETEFDTRWSSHQCQIEVPEDKDDVLAFHDDALNASSRASQRT